jgi:hypothetical protein
MPVTDSPTSIGDGDNLPNRRDSFRLLAGIAALATSLGVPRSALAAGSAARFTFKFYRGKQDGGGLLDTTELPDNVVDYLTSPAGARIQIKMYDKSAREVGSIPMPAQVVIKMSEQKRAG